MFSAALVGETYKVQQYMENKDNYYNVAEFFKEISDLSSSQKSEEKNAVPQ